MSAVASAYGIIENLAVLPPTPKYKSRKTIEWHRNLAPAFVPSKLLKIPEELWAVDISEEQKICLRRLLQKDVRQLIINMKVPVSLGFIESISDAIMDHVEIRIQLFWQQVLLVCRTGRDYILHDTNCQIGNGCWKISQRDPTKEEAECERSQYQAAHSATIPCLKYLQDGAEVVHGLGSSFAMTWNTTVLLPREVNKLDLMIDGRNNQTSKLRHAALAILNQVAKFDGYEPQKALKKFLKQMHVCLENVVTNQEERIDAHIIGCYRNVVASYQEQLSHPLFMRKISFIANEEDAASGSLLPFLNLARTMQAQMIFDRNGSRLKVVLVGYEEEQSALETSFEDEKPLSGRALQYANYCKTLNNVVELVRKYRESDESGTALNALKQCISCELKMKYQLTRNPQHLTRIVQGILTSVRI